MKKKLGPLPVWAWAAIGAGVLVFMYWRSRQSSSSSSTDQVDPSNPLGLTYGQETADIAQGIDPNTGQTYAAEQSVGAAGGGGVSSGTSSDDLSTIDSDLGIISSQLATLQGGTGLTDSTTPGGTFLGEVQDVTGTFGALGINLGVTPATASSTSAGGGGAGTITTHPGGAFYNFYTSVMGKPPPQTLSTSNLIYSAWKAGKTITQTKSLVKPTGSGAAGSAGGSTTARTTVTQVAKAGTAGTKAATLTKVSGKKH